VFPKLLSRASDVGFVQRMKNIAASFVQRMKNIAASWRICTPGVGPIISTAVVAAIGDRQWRRLQAGAPHLVG
jgi:hypothetical protein